MRIIDGHHAPRKRFFTAAALATGLSLTLAACAGGGDGGEATGTGDGGGDVAGTELTYAGFGGSYEEAVKESLFDPFSEETGVEVLYDTSGSSVARLIEMSDAGAMTLDLIDAEDSTLAQFIAADVLQPLDLEVDPEDFANPDAITEYSVPWYIFSRNIFWNTDTVDELESWEDLFDLEANPGKRGFLSLPWGTLEGALIADGVAVDDLYPLDLDRAFAKLDEIRDETVFFQSNGDLQNAVAQGEVDAGYINLARLKTVEESGGVPVDYTWTGAVLSTQQLVIPEGAPNQPAAVAAIEYGLTDDSQQAILDSLGYTPSRTSVLETLDAETLADLPGTEETASDETFYINTEWWAENGADTLERWQAWLNS
jgi:putative spermidine/putrescine transport system substrate-binding protein